MARALRSLRRPRGQTGGQSFTRSRYWQSTPRPRFVAPPICPTCTTYTLNREGPREQQMLELAGDMFINHYYTYHSDNAFILVRSALSHALRCFSLQTSGRVQNAGQGEIRCHAVFRGPAARLREHLSKPIIKDKAHAVADRAGPRGGPFALLLSGHCSLLALPPGTLPRLPGAAV